MRVKNEMDEDEQGKLFVGGLSWETTQDSLQRYFGRYGEVIDCVVMKNPETGRSRGFGFVTFSDPENVGLVLQNGPHNLDGRTIDPKPCNPRTLQKPKRNSSYPKVFLGGLPSNVTETDLRTYFARFGKVMEVVIMYDQEKKKSRGFGFLSFEDDDAVDRCVSEHFVNLSGKQVEIKKAEPRDSNKMNDSTATGTWGPPQSGPMSMGGMGMGGPNSGMGGPMASMGGPVGHGNMMQGYPSWGSTPQSGYPGQWGPSNQPPMNGGLATVAGYAGPSGPGSYQSWGAPPGPQGQQMPPQWGSSYGAPPQQTGYSSYDFISGSTQSGYGSNWNWNMPQNGPGGQGGPTQGPPGPQGDMYTRGGGGAGAGPTGPTPPGASVPPKGVNDYPTYPSYTPGYQQESSSYGGGGRSFVGPESGPQGTGAPIVLSDYVDKIEGPAHPPCLVTGGLTLDTCLGTVYPAPGPKRSSNHGSSSQQFHPYRRN